jgi:CheY-like chemotaxis protein
VKLELDQSGLVRKSDFRREPSARRSMSGAKVMIVDDSEDNQDLLAAFLSTSKIVIARASRGGQAVELADDSFDAILMDIQMPEMDGFEALRKIRAKGVKAPVIAVTAHAMKGDRERCLAGGFDEYLSKPISRKSLDECLSHFI